MRYRKFGKSNWDISILSFGTLRLPVKKSNWRRVDEELATKMIHIAIEGGVNFFDSAYHYHFGMSETILGKALQNEHRQKVKIATKLPTSIIRSKADFNTILNKQLRRLQTDHIDFYLFQSLNCVHWEALKKFEPIEWAEKAVRAGKIGSIGFSFHDKLPVFKEIVEYWDKWDFCYIQYNYLDTDSQAGTEGLKLAYEKGIPVIVMEPLRGGQLTKIPTPEIGNIWKSLGSDKSIVDLALQWIWDHKEVNSLMSGMSCLDDIEKNLKIADSGFPGCLNEREKEIILRIKNAIEKLNVIPCTGCNYCMPCPHRVFIPGIIEIYNEWKIYQEKDRAQAEYNVWITREFRADNCKKCGICEKICPQGIEIIKWLEVAHKTLTEL